MAAILAMGPVATAILAGLILPTQGRTLHHIGGQGSV